MSLSKKY
jgi:DNA topoisomerase-2